jgi:hypothetical protein
MCAIKLAPLYDRCIAGCEDKTDWMNAVAIAKLVKDIAALTESDLPEDVANSNSDDVELTEEDRADLGR